jgi:MoaA/NifB/PqqE/SkfB family radical SAM enzyme
MKPILLHYYITNRCNARCAFCDIWQARPKADALPEHVVPNLAQARKAGCRFVDFTGGEPLLNKHLPLFLHEAKKLGFITSVTTNAILFQERAAELAGLIDLLHFSLDADTAEEHNRIRGVDSYSAVIESIPVALANRLVPDLLFTYTDVTIRFFEGVYRLARKNHLMVILDPVFTLDGKDAVSPSTHAYARKLGRRPGIYLNTAHLALRGRGGNSMTDPLCKAASSTIVILPDNMLVLPCFHHAVATVPIAGNLPAALAGPGRRDALRYQGAYPFCDGCHINCYFDPTFTCSINPLLVESVLCKAGYSVYKYLVYRRPLPRPLTSLFR